MPRHIPKTDLSYCIESLSKAISIVSLFSQVEIKFFRGCSLYNFGFTSCPPVNKNPSHISNILFISLLSVVRGRIIGVPPAFLIPSRYPGSIHILSLSSSQMGVTPIIDIVNTSFPKLKNIYLKNKIFIDLWIPFLAVLVLVLIIQ